MKLCNAFAILVQKPMAIVAKLAMTVLCAPGQKGNVRSSFGKSKCLKSRRHSQRYVE